MWQAAPSVPSFGRYEAASFSELDCHPLDGPVKVTQGEGRDVVVAVRPPKCVSDRSLADGFNVHRRESGEMFNEEVDSNIDLNAVKVFPQQALVVGGTGRPDLDLLRNLPPRRMAGSTRSR